MLFTCKPQSCAAARPAERRVICRKNKRLAVDLHCHVHTAAADELVRFELARAQKDQITGGNAAKLLRLRDRSAR